MGEADGINILVQKTDSGVGLSLDAAERKFKTNSASSKVTVHNQSRALQSLQPHNPKVPFRALQVIFMLLTTRLYKLLNECIVSFLDNISLLA